MTDIKTRVNEFVSEHKVAIQFGTVILSNIVVHKMVGREANRRYGKTFRRCSFGQRFVAYNVGSFKAMPATLPIAAVSYKVLATAAIAK